MGAVKENNKKKRRGERGSRDGRMTPMVTLLHHVLGNQKETSFTFGKRARMIEKEDYSKNGKVSKKLL